MYPMIGKVPLLVIVLIFVIFSVVQGSMVGMTVFYPLDTVRSRLILDDKRKAKSTIFVIADLIKEEGFWTLYRGIIPMLQSLCASNFVYFYVYHGLKGLTYGTKGNKDILLATVAGAVNVLVTTPLWLVNTRMKMSGVTDNPEYKGLLDGLQKISEKEGVLSLWNGTLPSLLLVSNPAIHMAVYQALKRKSTSRTALSFFLLSALAKITATVMTYPIQLAQAKLRHNSTHKSLQQRSGTAKLLLYILKSHGVSGLYKGMEAKLLQTVLATALMFATYEKIVAFVFKIMKQTKYE